MKTKTANLLGTALIALGFLMFFLMVYCIIVWGPAFCGMMFVIMLMLAGGAMLMMRRPAGPSMSEAAKLPDSPFADGRRNDGTGKDTAPSAGPLFRMVDRSAEPAGRSSEINESENDLSGSMMP